MLKKLFLIFVNFLIIFLSLLTFSNYFIIIYIEVAKRPKFCDRVTVISYLHSTNSSSILFQYFISRNLCNFCYDKHSDF